MRRYYEFAIVVILVSILALLLLRSLETAHLEVEEARVQAEVAALRIALLEVEVHKETFGGALPASHNPFDWVAVRPGNYLGVLDGVPDQCSVWYFERPAEELVYRFCDGRQARFRFSRGGGREMERGNVAGVGLSRLADRYE